MPTSVADDATVTSPEETIRDRAVRRLKKRRDFHAHLLVYVLANGCFTAVWFAAGAHGFFWPVFLIGFWGIGVVMNAWDVYHGEDFSEDQIQREMRRLSA